MRPISWGLCLSRCGPWPIALVNCLTVLLAVWEILPKSLVADDQPPGPMSGPASESPLDRAVEELSSTEAAQESPLDRAVRELGAAPDTPPSSPATAALPTPTAPNSNGGAQLKLVDISLDGLFAAGWSTENDVSLQDLQGGGHDPRNRGFTIRGVELSMQGAVDPYLGGEMHLGTFLDPIEGATEVELEEAFMTTRTLPHGLQLKAGQFLTEFGRINPTHPHAWAWLDQPIIATRLFGPDGMRAPGVRLSWLVPGDRFTQVYATVQNANGETMASFLANQEFFDERPIGGRPFVYHDVETPLWTWCTHSVGRRPGPGAAKR